MTSLPWRSTGNDVVTSKHCYNWWKEVEERCEVNVKSVLLKKAHIQSRNIEKRVTFIKDMINSSILGYF